MRRYINYFLWIILFTFIILFSYDWMNENVSFFSPDKMIHFFKDSSIRDKVNETIDDSFANFDLEEEEVEDHLKRSIWLSYLEFEAYYSSVSKNNEKNFRIFFKDVLSHCQECKIKNIIVQVRPFSDALYESEYFPWSACISGKQGSRPGYDPLAIMTEMAHKNGMTIEAWVNPYRVTYASSLSGLIDDHPAKKWSKNKKTSRYVLSYNKCYYYNPSIPEVRKLILNGIVEIVKNYDVDGIHIDDYFYPSFTEKNVYTAFDAKEYEQAKKDHKIKADLKISDWRRDNVNQLIRDIYKAIKKEKKDILFGISPNGNIDNLTSNYQNYVDIKEWLSKEGYVDYIMPQIYWGFEHETAAFDRMVNSWVKLTQNSDVDLQIGLQLYQMGTTDQNYKKYPELQSADLIRKEMSYLNRFEEIEGCCFFSYEYLDAGSKKYHYGSTKFQDNRKKILSDVVHDLKE